MTENQIHVGTRPARRGRRFALGAAGTITAIVVSVAPAHASTPHSVASRASSAVGGVVVNSKGRALTHLSISVDAHNVRGRSFRFNAKTDGHGRSRLRAAAGRVGAIRWTAAARFHWHGGVWLRELNTLSNRSSRLKFRADVVARGADSYAHGVSVRIMDWGGCTSLWADPSYVATDPGTQAIRLHFTPVGRLVDGTSARGGTVTLPSSALCNIEGVGHQVVAPAGAWKITGVTNHGRILKLSPHVGAGPYSRALTLFNHPMPYGDSLQYADVRFAS